MSMSFPSGKGIWWSNICQIIPLTFCFNKLPMLYMIWIPYTKLHVRNYRKVHHDKMSYVVVLKVKSQKNTYTSAILSKFLAGSNELLRIREDS